ncbi:hypothetical protein CXB51_029042 [Gossypium anomalum]|uniref:Aminotransferase-like plant mobile domain-containing protein n=1 Tax=Gossypium anomalum TaxID=47600 RepID=A0A8J5Y857_9ROSI|nr:hypothetical protein CXB51_029042 [Gossypium anomalum]
MPDKARNLVHLRWLLKFIDFRTVDELSWGSTVLAALYREMSQVTQPNKIKIEFCLSLWNHSPSYGRIPTALEDIQLLLDQRSEVHFQWISYEDPTIQAVIPSEFRQNLNIWHVRVPLVSLLPLRCTRRIECCSNSDSENRFSWHLKCLMMSTKLTYDD